MANAAIRVRTVSMAWGKNSFGELGPPQIVITERRAMEIA
jgi:hypothetical protein